MSKTNEPAARGLAAKAKLIRPITWPVIAACPSSAKTWGEPTKAQLGELHAIAREVFREATQCANWIASRLAAVDGADFILAKRMKTPPPEIDTKPIYAIARKAFPELDCQTVSAILRHVLARYKSNRHAVLCQGSRALESYRFPQTVTYKVEESPCRIVTHADGSVRIEIKLCFGLNGTRTWWTCEVPSDGRFEAHRNTLQEVLDGKRDRGAATFRLGARGDLMVAVTVPRDAASSEQVPTRALLVSSSPDDLLVLTCQGFHGRQIPAFHEEWIRQKIRLHDHYRKRMAEDLKTARRSDLPGRKRRDTRRAMLRSLNQRCERQHARIMDRLHKVARAVANYAKRNRVACVIGDFRCTSWVEPFPWHALRRMVADKLDESAIAHTNLRTDAQDTPPPAAPNSTGGCESEGYTWHGESTAPRHGDPGRAGSQPGSTTSKRSKGSKRSTKSDASTDATAEAAAMATVENVSKLMRRITRPNSKSTDPAPPGGRSRRCRAESARASNS